LTDNALYYGDNLEIMRELLNERGAFIDLIYIDPPFNSKRNYNILFKDRKPNAKNENDKKPELAQVEAFKDIWSNVDYQDNIDEIKLKLNIAHVGEYLDFVKAAKPKSYVSYLSMMAIRIYYMRELLKDSGSFYLHCDPTMSHYLKVVCDLIFGEDNFISEIVWNYGTPSGGRAGAKKPVKSHEILLVYAKSYGSHTYNKQYTPYSEKYVEDWFRNTDSKGRKYQTRTRKGKVVRQYLDESPGVPLSDTFTDIKQLYGSSGWFPTTRKEILDYPTQKPLALLKRIVAMSSNANETVADFFAGCGTTIDAAIELNRNYIGADISVIGVALVQKRIREAHQHTQDSQYKLHGLPVNIEQARKLASENPFEFQNWAVAYLAGGVPNEKKTGDGGVDGWLYFRPRATDELHKCVIEIKGGANLNIAQVRAFIKTVQEDAKRFGMLLTMGEITDGMRRECGEAGRISGLRRCEVVSIADLMNGVKPDIITLGKSYAVAAPKNQRRMEESETP